MACQDVECPLECMFGPRGEDMFGPRGFPGLGEISPSNPSIITAPSRNMGPNNMMPNGIGGVHNPVHAESSCLTDPEGSADWTPQPTDPPPAACTADPALPQSAASADKAAAELPAAAHYCSTRPEARRPKQQIGSLQNQITAQQAQYLKNQQPQQQSSPNLLLENNGPWSNAHGSDAGSGEKPTNTNTSEKDNFGIPEFVMGKVCKGTARTTLTPASVAPAAVTTVENSLGFTSSAWSFNTATTKETSSTAPKEPQGQRAQVRPILQLWAKTCGGQLTTKETS